MSKCPDPNPSIRKDGLPFGNSDFLFFLCCVHPPRSTPAFRNHSRCRPDLQLMIGGCNTVVVTLLTFMLVCLSVCRERCGVIKIRQQGVQRHWRERETVFQTGPAGLRRLARKRYIDLGNEQTRSDAVRKESNWGLTLISFSRLSCR